MQGRTIQDEFSHLKSKGRRLYYRRRRDGVCVNCGKKRMEGSLLCEECREQNLWSKKKGYVARPKPRKSTGLKVINPV